ncbi:MAG: type III-A CRISPR-associated protein Csm2 [Flammeovirgaceae bacterium]
MKVIKENFDPVREFQAKWITQKIDKAGINYLENFGFYLCDKKSVSDRYPGYAAVTVSQIRNVFGEIKRIASGEENPNWDTDFYLLRPKIAYNAARVLAKKQKSRIKDFKTVLEKAHNEVQERKHLDNFAKFVEGIVAYHKVYGGKE